MEDGQIIVDFTPSYQELSDLNEARDIDTLVRSILYSKLPVESSLIKVEKDEPFYRLYYSVSQTRIVVDLSFNPFTRQITINNFSAVSSPATTPDTVVQQPKLVVSIKDQTP